MDVQTYSLQIASWFPYASWIWIFLPICFDDFIFISRETMWFSFLSVNMTRHICPQTIDICIRIFKCKDLSALYFDLINLESCFCGKHFIYCTSMALFNLMHIILVTNAIIVNWTNLINLDLRYLSHGKWRYRNTIPLIK